MAFVGLIFLFVGLGVMYFAKQTQGVSGAVLFILGLLLFVCGIYALFFETGEGAGRWMSWMR